MSLIKKNPKILVEIIGSARTIKRKLEIDETGSEPYVIVNKGGKGRGDLQQKAKFSKSCLVPYTTGFLFFFRSTKFKLILKEGSTECVNFTENTQAAASCTPKDVTNYFRAACLRAAGSLTGKEQKLTILYILLIVSIVISIISLLVGAGKIRIG